MKTKLLVIAVSIAVFIGGLLFWRYNQTTNQQVIMTLNAQEKETVDAILKDKKTYCIGNYNIELPDGMVMDKETKPVIRFDDVSLVSQRMYYPAFEQRIRLREAELKQTKPINPADSPYLKSVHPLTDGVKGVIFERMESIGIPDSERVLEAHFYKDGVAFTQKLKARNETTERYEAEIKQHPELGENNVPQKINVLNELIVNIGGRNEEEPLSMSGICIPNAFLSASGLGNIKQDVVVTLTSNKYPQLSMVLETRNYNPDSESLLSFRRYAEPDIHENGGYVIRKGDKHINGLISQEWLAKDIKQRKKEYFDFYLLINGQQVSESKPILFVNMMWEQSENHEKLTDAEVLALWDSVVNTIRHR